MFVSVQVYWRIFGPNNPLAALEATNDIAFVSGNRELTSGTLNWPDGQAGERTFSLDIKPFTSWEIEKTFVIRLEKIVGSPASVGDGEVSPTTGSVTLTVRFQWNINCFLGGKNFFLLECSRDHYCNFVV